MVYVPPLTVLAFAIFVSCTWASVVQPVSDCNVDGECDDRTSLLQRATIIIDDLKMQGASTASPEEPKGNVVAAKVGMSMEVVKKLLFEVFPWVVDKMVSIYKNGVPPISGEALGYTYTVSTPRLIDASIGGLETQLINSGESGMHAGFKVLWSGLTCQLGAHYVLEYAERRKTVRTEGDLVVGIGGGSRIGATVGVGLGEYYLPYVTLSDVEVNIDISELKTPDGEPLLPDLDLDLMELKPILSEIATEAFKEAMNWAFSDKMNQVLQARMSPKPDGEPAAQGASEEKNGSTDERGYVFEDLQKFVNGVFSLAVKELSRLVNVLPPITGRAGDYEYTLQHPTVSDAHIGKINTHLTDGEDDMSTGVYAKCDDLRMRLNLEYLIESAIGRNIRDEGHLSVSVGGSTSVAVRAVFGLDSTGFPFVHVQSVDVDIHIDDIGVPSNDGLKDEVAEVINYLKPSLSSTLTSIVQKAVSAVLGVHVNDSLAKLKAWGYDPNKHRAKQI